MKDRCGDRTMWGLSINYKSVSVCVRQKKIIHPMLLPGVGVRVDLSLW